MNLTTVAERLADLANCAKDSSRDFLNVHASIHHEPTRRFGGERVRTPWGIEERGGGISIGYSAWNPLLAEGTRAQAAALRVYRTFAEVTRTLLTGQPANLLGDFDRAAQIITAALEQQGPPCGQTPAEVFAEVSRAIDAQVATIANLQDNANKEAIIVPDTNALLYNPSLEDWAFESIPRFMVVLLPTVLKELDALKVTHRVEDVRKKAEGLITRIKGYRGRGRLNDGVPLRKGTSSLRAVAAEPDMAATLSWLDSGNDDDRLLASFLDVMRLFPQSPVILVTRDINLQNKAEMAGVIFAEPPEPRPLV